MHNLEHDLIAQHNKACIDALDPTRSFIVQAPAGSGKTELLTQRYLKLLSHIQKGPEEIIAITFTKKAAAQMRARIVNALIVAKTQAHPPELAHAQVTWHLARAALKHCEAKQWDIIAYPNRLRILTIDALCAHLASRMPVLSHFGAVPEVTTEPEILYEKAVRSLILDFNNKKDEQGVLSSLLKHVDNRLDLAQNLMIMMLQKRDQWLPYIGSLKAQDNLIASLELSLQRIIIKHLKRSYALCQKIDIKILYFIIDHCIKNLRETGTEHPLCNWMYDRDNILPEPIVDNITLWIAIANLFLTKEGNLRQSLTIQQGFLAPSKVPQSERALAKEHKDAMIALLESLSDNIDFKMALQSLTQLPPSTLSDEHARIIQALMSLLPLLTAHLTLQFKDTGHVDFTEVSLRAIAALGAPQEPSDLALSLDYQLQHLLIDEFQDSSFSQFTLFEKLVAGWSVGDGRTVFLVGDPMQSIYHFRGAEVGLFLQVQEQGLGSIPLTALQLSRNFRTHSGMIEWINNCFKDLFPHTEDKNTGAIKYAPAVAGKSSSLEDIDTHNAGIHFWGHSNISSETELRNNLGQVLLEALQDATKQNTQSTPSIAILVRARHHIEPILPILRQLHIPFEAHDIEKLATQQPIVDLWSLTQAMLDLTDKIAWLAILRAPWCGLSLHDLYIIAADKVNIIWSVLLQHQDLALSYDAQSRLKRVVPILKHWLEHRQKHQLAPWIKGVWLALGGPLCYGTDMPVVSYSSVFFECLEKASRGADLLNFALFENKLKSLFAQGYAHANTADDKTHNRVQIMTIHKAKGLEFDIVIIPAIEKIVRSTQTELLIWYEHQHEEGIDLIVAPRKAQHQTEDSLYQYVNKELVHKTELENVRLLYVALTRAKKQIHLFGQRPEKEPLKGSFLSYLWPKLTHSQIMESCAHLSTECRNQASPNEQERVLVEKGVLQRLPATWRLPAQWDKIEYNTNIDSSQTFNKSLHLNRAQNEYKVDKLVGTFVHRIIQSIAELGLAHWDKVDLLSCIPAWEQGLSRIGVRLQDTSSALNTVRQAIKQILQDPMGRYILANNHKEAYSEWSLYYQTKNGIKQVIIDRSFIDKEGIRWIVDYKLADALAPEYQQQLLQYAKIVSRLENRDRQSIRCGIYFPLKSSPDSWQEINNETSKNF